jgi:hypothetical protein
VGMLLKPRVLYQGVRTVWPKINHDIDLQPSKDCVSSRSPVTPAARTVPAFSEQAPEEEHVTRSYTEATQVRKSGPRLTDSAAPTGRPCGLQSVAVDIGVEVTGAIKPKLSMRQVMGKRRSEGGQVAIARGGWHSGRDGQADGTPIDDCTRAISGFTINPFPTENNFHLTTPVLIPKC